MSHPNSFHEFHPSGGVDNTGAVVPEGLPPAAVEAMKGTERGSNAETISATVRRMNALLGVATR